MSEATAKPHREEKTPTRNEVSSEKAQAQLQVEIQAAKLRVLLDERRNLKTPEWVKELARKSA